MKPLKSLKIRDVPGEVIIKLDEISRKQNLSREEFLRRNLKIIAMADEIYEVESKYKLLMDKVLGILNLNTIVLKKFMDENLITFEEIDKNGDQLLKEMSEIDE
ncbi:hypothetical protein NMF85_09925 [Clostridioides difficile]|uniref:hypothetical protein n=1 Tax=Clostridioides difficile TaxID=1496 RepID=UPI001C1BF250|nr:hypothetical protein [Clostridioides difficile]MCP8337837.1 hypothetical protein [Clostridioides difficile]MCP8365804.1 hypothetical protein [Clostridioides difficile]MCP8383261.1 hypothetical protein [Clostridioides difficile]MCP8415623.1 hypothetical protein [Clostridioides difficile]MCP8664502.1 hypothetical protein [Clostridioides difficile]